QDKVILKTIALRPGQPLLNPDLKLAERNLERLGIFQFKKDKGIRQTVPFLESDSDCRKILVQEKKVPTDQWKLAAGTNLKAYGIIETGRRPQFEWPTGGEHDAGRAQFRSHSFSN